MNCLRLELKELIGNILLISILDIIVDMSLPNGDLKKYTKFLINLIMLTMILKPFFNIHNVALLNDGTYINYNQMTEMDIKSQSQIIDKVQAQQIKELFKKNVENQIKTQIESVTRFQNTVVLVELDNIDGYMYIIDKIYIKTRDVEMNNEKITTEINSEHKELLDIINYLSSLYNVPRENITIEIYG